MRTILLLAIVALSIAACHTSSQGSNASAPIDSAQWILDQSIIAHGGGLYQNFRLDFDFRNRHYVVDRKGGSFQYERSWTTDSTGFIRDMVSNKGFTRYQDGKEVNLSAEDSSKYANSVNSVAYFIQLPYGLNDPAVHKKLEAHAVIEGEPYYKIRVTFGEENGGKDHDDIYYYWVHKDSFLLNYFGYYYFSDGGGSRLRKAINPRFVSGLRVQDYINYTYGSDSIDVSEFDRAINDGNLREVSRIIKENVSVTTREM